MVLKRVLTGTAAAVIMVFSVSVFGVMWEFNRYVQAIEPAKVQDKMVWEGRRYIGELYLTKGRLEKLVVYCR